MTNHLDPLTRLESIAMFELGVMTGRVQALPSPEEHAMLKKVAAKLHLDVPEGVDPDFLPDPAWFAGPHSRARRDFHRIGVLAFALFLLRGERHAGAVSEMRRLFEWQSLDDGLREQYLVALSAGDHAAAFQDFTERFIRHVETSWVGAGTSEDSATDIGEAAAQVHEPGSNIHPPFEAYKGRDPFLFASYAHADADLVYPELVRIRSLGLNIWYDEGIDPGNEWPDAIAGAIGRSSYFIAFITPAAVSSANCRNEINFALNHRKPFLAIHLSNTQLPAGLSLRMGDIQAVMRFRMDERSFERKLRLVFESLLGGAGN